VVRRRGRASARRLGVGRIDLYQVHQPNPLVPIEKTMRGMRDLQEEGVISEVGVSNFDLGGWKAAERALGSRVISNQVQYSLVSRGPERELIPWAEANGRMVIAYSPLAQGVLTGKYHRGSETRDGFLGTINPLFLPENLERARPLIDKLREVADGHAAEGATPAQVALAWTIRSHAVVAIPGASSVAQLESNVAAAHLKLADDEVAVLSAAADAFEPVPIGALRQTRAVASALARGLADSLARRMRRDF
jgi:aryl-alcohol dehydrogenase-like predicted oxidoreductase